VRWSDTVDEVIFADFVASTTPDVVPEDIADECREMWKSLSSKNKSSKFGWQSEVYNTLDSRIPNNCKALIDLMNVVMEFANEYLHTNQLISNMTSVKEAHWWVNINPTHAFNTIHTHARADAIAIYYPESHDESGLVVVRNDGSSYSEMYKGDHEEFQQKFAVPCVKGRLFLFPGHVWHYVVANQNPTERISVSYNIYLNS